MALVRPFHALRPTPEVAPAVASVPYDVVSRAEALALTVDNPLSFLHVSRSEVDLDPEDSPCSRREVVPKASVRLTSTTGRA